MNKSRDNPQLEMMIIIVKYSVEFIFGVKGIVSMPRGNDLSIIEKQELSDDHRTFLDDFKRRVV